MEITQGSDPIQSKNINHYRRNCIIKVIVFILIFALLLSFTSKIFSVNTRENEYAFMNSIYNEPANTLDAVYIGSSNCYYYWNSLAAYREYGITVLPFASSAQSIVVAEYMIKEARKTQSDAVFLVNVNTMIEPSLRDNSMHFLLDNMPFSLNKLELTKHLTELAGLSFSESLEYYFPLIRYHSRWNELNAANFGNAHVDYKNCLKGPNYLNTYTDVSEGYRKTKKTEPLDDVLTDTLNSLLDYCDEENVKIVFITVPQARKYYDDIKQYNAMNELISSRGYPVVDLLNNINKTGIDTETDFYNRSHVNIHGSLKYTHYISKYLIENYGFTDKRGNMELQSWEKALKAYQPNFDKFTLDIELESGNRDYSIKPIEEISVEIQDREIAVSWTQSDNADGYAIYRSDGRAWSKIDETGDCIYIDTQVVFNEEGTLEKTYKYTVVPYVESDGNVLYGEFNYVGVSASAAE